MFLHHFYLRSLFLLHLLPLPSGCPHLGCSYSLNTYLSGKQSELIILLVLFKAGRQKAHLLWGMSSRNSALLPSSLPIFAHHPLQGTEIFLNETGMHRFVMFAIQKGRISSTKVVEKEIIKSFSMKV